jgi:probable rRNA maturation factor
LIRLSLAPGKVPRKTMNDLKTYEKQLSRVTKAFAAMPWRKNKADVSRRKKSEVLVHLISDAVMKKLNTQYRHKAKATDVLSFSYIEGEASPFDHEPVGEVYISLDTAVRQAKTWNTTLAEELAILTVHGALHVMGYDHEKSPTEEKKMRRAEKLILDAAGLPTAGLTHR